MKIQKMMVALVFVLAFSGMVRGALAACPGDLSDNGSVDAADLAMLLGAWGTCGAVFGCIGGTEEAPELSGTCEAQTVCCVPVPNECTDAGGVCAASLFGCAGDTTEDPALSPGCESDQICCI